ncbi:uncharacterized protein [Aegilops tauschii subsp. strangulata]|uniref:uncharacterized protein n=1 Tax=Aegilops tauschii subsp. strangulata TaxID=200361 RepID=UPI003CC8CE8F
MSLLCWNCRGAGKSATVRELRDLTRQHATSITCILETKIEGSRVENLIGSLGYNKSFAVRSSGRSGGLGIFWNEEIKLEVVGYSEYHIDVIVDEMVDIQTRVTFVYGEARTNECYKMWDMLHGIAGTSTMPWLVLGDFNEVIHAHEHDGVGNRNQAQMDLFRDALDTCGLSNIGYSRKSWTFEKRVTGGTYTRVRLDRGVANPAWSIAFPGAELRHLTTAASDHVPLLLHYSDVHACRRGSRPFKYEICWERDEALPVVVETAWGGAAADSVSALQGRLQSLAGDLSRWDRTHFGNVGREIDQLKKQLHELREISGRSGPNHVETKVIDRLTELYHQEEMLWRQRARLEWLVHGDKNTYFFHLRASRRRRKNQIKMLQRPDGQMTENLTEMEALATSFYEDLYTSEGVSNMNEVLDTVPCKVTQAMNDILNAPYS